MSSASRYIRMAIYVGIALVAFAAAGIALANIALQRPLEEFASAIERGRAPKVIDEALRTRVKSLMVNSDASCQRRNVQSRVTVSLFLLRNGAPGDRERDLQLFEQAVDHGVACNPFDGNLWLLAAMNYQRKGDEAGFVHAWSNSLKMSPFEGYVLDLRWTLAPQLLASGALPLTDAVKADLDRTLRFSDVRQAGRVLFLLQQAQLPAIAMSAKSLLAPQRLLRAEQNRARWAALNATPDLKSPFRSDYEN